MISQPSRHCTVELQALPSRIGQVRRILSAQLRYWHLDPLIDQAALGVTELLTNVHQHAEPDKVCTVDIELLLDRLTVSVQDHDPRLPTLRDGGDLFATSGRGLGLIAAVSENWGVRPQGDLGKVVWFSLTAAPPPVMPGWRSTVLEGVGDGHLSPTPRPLDTHAPAAGALDAVREHAGARSSVGG
ncbi:ATP-binding protein [Streptomyces sp. NPDC051018]|uniref:ATP-binding protein n=1 Tax=Streptomyces sp. NPDC051018 TaxID=3365639 RepID=UPI0037956FD3